LAQLHRKQVPVFIKIAPDLEADQVSVIANTLKRHCMDTNSQSVASASWGVIATNTTIARDAVQGLQHAEETGGLSGAPVFEKSNAVIRQLRDAMGPHFPIMGVGGVLSGDDAVAKIKAGANLVQIYTGLIYKGPALVKEAALALKNAG
jgi:dihydroorotate dehydrogenase